MRVLIVEDDPDFLALVQTYVSQLDGVSTHAVRTWGAAQAALDDCDVVLLDLHLPDSRLNRSIENIRGLDPGVAVIVMSSFLSPEDEIKPILAGAQEVLLKDEITAESLGRSLRRALARRQTRAARGPESAEEQRAGAAVARELGRLSDRESLGRGLPSDPLVEMVPGVVLALLDEHERLLDAVVHARTSTEPQHPREEIRAYAATLADLRFGPRELTEVHGAVLRRQFRTSDRELGGVITSEGRLLLVEVMGHLVRAYRGQMMAGVNEATPAAAASTGGAP
ncbi:response regulator [Euzebya tangerina]|uniref:response regulator n=1 Tax=Euzebya tangerina TaxID=591198 RepID=UPI000E31EB39|nr:response regulator [Euzebya tangerina]